MKILKCAEAVHTHTHTHTHTHREFNKNKGITLIALVITIIILLILAGITISSLIGENGLLEKIKQASEKHKQAEEKEQETLEEFYKLLGLEGELPENTPTTEAGTVVKLEEGWGEEAVNYYKTSDGTEVKNVTKVSTVYAVSVGNGETIPVPKGFYYVGGTLDTGAIISDNVEDKFDGTTNKTTYEYARSLKGNQFVWIPCETSEYKKCDTWNGIKQTNNTLGTNWWDTTTPKSELTQVEKYGGFYVARYEAGLANTISEFTETQENTGSNQIYNKEGIPQSKAGIIPWNFIDWNNSKKNAERMYNNNYVSSGLITGTQWDVILNKMVSKNVISARDLIDSNNWGNHRNEVLTYTGRLSKLTYSSGKLYMPVFGVEATNGKTEDYKNDNINGDLLTTGASSATEKYHIFDMAGNLWEWTEEMSMYSTSKQNRINRGGSFIWGSNTFPACTRGSGEDIETTLDEGFRVVLYIK